MVHILNYMHAITPSLTLGFSLMHMKQNGKNSWAYVGQYEWDKFKVNWCMNPFAPEKLVVGLVGLHGKRLNTYAEFKVDQTDKTEVLLGFKTKFIGGEVKGNIATTGKVQSVYRKFLGMFDMELQSGMDLFKPQEPCVFGVGLSMRQM